MHLHNQLGISFEKINIAFDRDKALSVKIGTQKKAAKEQDLSDK